MTDFLTLQPEAAEALTETLRAARWIWSAHPFDLHEAYVDLRGTFRLADRPGTVLLYITADSRYRVWVNGRLAGHGPERCYPHAQSVDALDISDLIQTGPNLIAAQVYQPGYSHFAYVHRAAAGLLAVVQANGHSVFATGEHWKARRNTSWREQVPRVSIYGSGVEIRDLSQDDAWMTNAYDDSDWPHARVVGAATSAPWTALTARSLPLLDTRELALTAPIVRRTVTVPAGDVAWSLLAGDPHGFVRDIWCRPALSGDGTLVSQWLFDLGRDHIGRAWAALEGAPGAQVLITYLEKFEDGRLVLSDPSTYCRVRLTDQFLLGPGRMRCAPFSARGGRYVLFTLVGLRADMAQFGFQADEYPLPAGRPALPDGDLEAIAALCERTVRACLSDGFVDSAWRESSTWVGDALPQALSLRALGADLRPLARVLELSAQGVYADGILPSVVPGEVHAYTIVDYNLMWVELLRIFFDNHDHDASARALWPTLVRLLDRILADVDPVDGLLRSQPGRRLFLDWAPVSRAEPNAIYNLQAVHALREAVALAQRWGESAQAADWCTRADRLAAAVRAAFWHDGRWWDDRERSTYSQLAVALAVRAGVAREPEIPALLDAIVARSLDLRDAHTPGEMVLASPFRHHDLFEALQAHGRRDEVRAIIRARWGRWARAGEPTAWENWDVRFADGSTCHAFSAHPLYQLLRDV